MTDEKQPDKNSAEEKEKQKKSIKFIGDNQKPGRRPDGKKGFKQDDEGMFWKKGSKTFLIWLIVIAGALLLINYFEQDNKAAELDYNEFTTYLDNVKKIEITNIDSNAEITGEFIKPQQIHSRQNREYSKFMLIVPSVTKETADEWSSRGISVKMRREQYGVSDFLISMIPWILILVLWFYLLKRMQGGGQGGDGKGIFSFGRSRAKLVDNAKNKITFIDVAGADEAKEELKEVIDFLKEPAKFTEMGAKVPKGVLLTGPPGTGKTLLAKAVAGEAGVPFFSISGADFVEMFVGVGASRVRDLFLQSKKNSPCILFIDELDAVGRHRGTGIGGGNDEREQTLNQLLVEMDGFDTEDNVIVIAATNRPDVLDPALLRPGRFDRHVVVDNPDVKAREEILKVHAKKVKMEKDIDLSIIAKGTPGMSGADLASIINESALFAARRGRKEIILDDVEEAKDKVMMGVERKSAVINENEKRITAYHEAGHVLIAKMTEGSDPVHKVTIIPRGRAMGLTHYLPIEEKHSYSKTYIYAKLLHLFGGRVAEELIFNDITTGASNDIERATDIARKMVCEWGMSEDIGPIHYGVKNDNPFLGKELTRTTSISEEIGKKIDAAVQNIIFKALEKTREVLSQNVDTLHKIAEALLEKETLTGSQIDDIVAMNAKNAKINGHDLINDI
ncbi:MAG TPA: ATP-dependent zinc metalloprotease FtsH [Clostridiales bacterium]|nr:ATP-dependent zinc metalloprotease FtsH [Clostridiales bacterium]HQP70482.1 ATP-dependent zinc metalloprotease FtsH [Clostridiales bacterium]